MLNTPSHHRVHHGRNPKYIDRNHAGTLIVWDRLFGTFKGEEEEPVYGITNPLASWNPLWANLHYWIELGGLARRTRSLRDRIRLFLKPPGWRPQELGGFVPAPEVDARAHRKYDPPAPPDVKLYVLVQFVLLNVVASLYLFTQGRLGQWGRIAAAAGIVVALVSLGGLLERQVWAFRLEAARAAVVFVTAGALLPGLALRLAGALAAAGLLGWLLTLHRRCGRPAVMRSEAA